MYASRRDRSDVYCSPGSDLVYELLQHENLRVSEASDQELYQDQLALELLLVVMDVRDSEIDSEMGFAILVEIGVQAEVEEAK